MKTILWIGDAGCGSGFGRATHSIGRRLTEQGYKVVALGVNYNGDPHDEPYPIYPCWSGGDAIGLGRLPSMMERFQPDLVVVQTNPWHVPHYMRELSTWQRNGKPIPVIGIIAVEGKNIEGRKLNKLTHAIFWTEFGRDEALAGGMTIPSSVIPLGVDLDLFAPGDRNNARRSLMLEECWPKGAPVGALDAFIIGNVNRNQHRKRLDLTLQYFAKWVRSRRIEDAYLYMHCLPGGSIHVNMDQLAGYFGRDEKHPHGIQDHIILSEPKNIFNGVEDKLVAETYRAFDVQINTGLGEGWGLTMMEGMACGVPQIGGDFSAFGEWARGAAVLVPCPFEGVMPDVDVMIGGFPDEAATIAALDELYWSPARRAELRRDGLQRVSESKYRWDQIATRYVSDIEQVLGQTE